MTVRQLYQQLSPLPSDEVSSANGHIPRRVIVAALLLAVLTVALFAPTWNHQMLYWDDDVNVLQNPLVVMPIAAGLKRIFTAPFSTDYYPLTYISLALDHFLWRGQFFGYHVTQTLLHGANAFLVVLLAWRWTKTFGVALLAGAWFAWHPVQVETVAWIAERKNVLGLCFVLLTWLVYLRARELDRPASHWLVAIILFIAAVLSHALVVVLPGMLFAYEITLGGVSLREAGRRTWLFFVPAAFAALMRVLGHSASQQLESQFHGAHETVPTMFGVLGQYLTNLVWPLQLNNYYVVQGVNRLSNPAVLMTIAWLALWIILYWRMPRMRRWLLFAVAWFLIALLPVSQLVPHPTLRADRYLYIAAISVFTLAGLLLTRNRRLFGVVAAVSLFGCLLLTRQRIPDWHDPKTLWTDCVAKNPRAAIGYFGLASCEIRETNYAAAEAHVRRILAFKPDLAEAHELLGAVLLLQDRKAEAREHLERALALKPNLPDARHNLMLLEQGRQ